MQSVVIRALTDAPSGNLALSDEQRSLSYSALRDAVAEESRWLQKHSVERCALLADNGAGWVIADLALLEMAALNVPLPGWFTPAQLDHAVADAGTGWILTDAPERAPLGFSPIATTPHSHLTLLRRDDRERAPPIPAGVVKVTYTSGSTGTAKGVCLTREALEQVARSIAFATPLGISRHLCTMPLATLLENVAGVYASLLLGATCIVPSARKTGLALGSLNAQAFLDTISRASPHSLILVPELLRLLISAAKHGWIPPIDLRFIAVGGAAISSELLEEAIALGLPAYEGYGLSECASVVCLNRPADARPGSVGKPLPHASVRTDEHGQIHVCGAVMSGYLGESCPTDEVATGDLGFIDADGYVYIRGRVKNMFITSMGRNVSPEWVESHLLRDPVIGQAIVTGEAHPYAIALISPAAPTITTDQIQRAIASANAHLPSYAQVRRWARLPRQLSFADGLLTANGRPRRDAIAQRYAELIEALYETALAS